MLLFKWKHHQTSRFGEWLVVLDDGRLLFRRITRGNNVAWDGQGRFERLDGPGRFFACLAFVVALAPGFGTSSSCLTLCDLSLVKVSGLTKSAIGLLGSLAQHLFQS